MKKDQRLAKIKEMENKIHELEAGWKRTQADFDNFRKRQDEQRLENIQLMKADFLTRLTPVLDNFSRAFEHAQDDQFAQGIRHIEKQLEDILTSEGLKKITAEPNIAFDPNIHEAISCEVNANIPSDKIISVVESGWMVDGKVIKPAKVRVSKGK